LLYTRAPTPDLTVYHKTEKDEKKKQRRKESQKKEKRRERQKRGQLFCELDAFQQLILNRNVTKSF
jgi:hypothetical protein